MANNRIYLRCKQCGKTLFLGKGFGGSYYTSSEFYKNKDLLESLNQFYEEHTWCDRFQLSEKEIKEILEDTYNEPKIGKVPVSYENNFEICYENYYGDLENEKSE